MKQCIAFGNCQVGVLKLYLSELSPFFEEYEFHAYANWELIQNNTMAIPIHKLKEADLVIYQPLGDEHGCYSTNKKSPDSFFNLLKPSCQTISFPRIHNNALWPVFLKHSQRGDMYGTIKNSVNSVDELIHLYHANRLDYDFLNRLNRNYTIGKEKEEETDVKIVDFIYDNLRTHKMFLTHDHPTSIVFNNIANQICDILDIPYDYKKGLTFDENIWGLPDSVYKHKNNQYPISRYSINSLGLQYKTEEDSVADSFYKEETIRYFNNKLKQI